MAQAEDSKKRQNLPSLGGASRHGHSGAEPRLGGEAALPYLVEALGGEETHERWRAAQALGEIGERATAELVARLGDPRDNVRKAASAALYSMGEGGLDALADALPGADPPTRREIVRLLGLIAAGEADGQVRANVLPLLAGILADPEAGVRGQAVEALGWLDDPAAVPALLAMLADEDGDVRLKAAAALVSIGGLAVAVGLRRALQTGDLEARQLAAQALEAVERGEGVGDAAEANDLPAL
jgi:HEAT repeat protein